jgi:uncharacterized membrane protein
MTSLFHSIRSCWLSLVFLAVNFALLAYLYDQLPDPMPSLWSDQGKIIDWIAKPAGALLLPVSHLVITLFMILAPVLDPGALRRPETPRIYPVLAAVVSGFLMLATSAVFAASLGSELSLPNAIIGGIGVMLAVVGNYLGKIPRNYILGIRTPWALSSDYVWERTHRAAGPVFVAGGIALFLYCILQRDSVSSILVSTTIIVTLLSPCFYSYLVWKRHDVSAA